MDLRDDGLLSEEEYKFLYNINEKENTEEKKINIIKYIKNICTYFKTRIVG